MNTTRKIQEVNMIDEYNHGKGFTILVCLGVAFSLLVTVALLATFVVVGMNAIYYLITALIK